MAANYDDVSDDETEHLLASHRRHKSQENVLERLFREKCIMSVQQDEKMYLQECVEHFASDIIKSVIESETYQNVIHNMERKGLLEINEHFQSNHLMTVGSYYDNTKNNYPDEFDFIFILAEGPFKENKRIQEITSDLSDLFHKQLKDLLSGTSFQHGGQFESSYTRLHGPASKIKLVFNDNVNLRDRTIYVDISVASRLQFGKRFPKELKVCYEEWTTMLVKTGSCLVIKVYKTDHPKHETSVKFTITETEQYFVRHEMSEKHRQVYRLLKYIINGNDANEILRNIIRRPENQQTKFSKLWFGKREGPRIVYDLPSYTIKTLIFHHVHQCQNEEGSMEECLKEVLKDLLAKFNETVDRFTTVWHNYKGIFAVSVNTMIGQPLEVADDYATAAIIGTKISKLLKTVDNLEPETETMYTKLDDMIPFTEQNVSTVSNFLDARSNRPISKVMLTFTIMCLISAVGISVGYGVVYYLKGQTCYTNNQTPGNNSNTLNYCCTGVRDETLGRDNVTCSRSNVFLQFSDNCTENIGVDLKQQNVLMISAAAHDAFHFEAGSVDCACNIVTHGAEITEMANENSIVTCCRITVVSGQNQTNDICGHYTDALSIMTSSTQIASFFFVTLPISIYSIKNRLKLINLVRRIRGIQTNYEQASVQQTSC